MHRKIALLSSFVFIVVLLFAVTSFAEYEDSNIGVYKSANKIFRCWILYEGGDPTSTDDWVAVGTDYSNDPASAPVIDIAAGSVSDQMGTFFSGLSIAPGTITHMKVKMSNAITIDGWSLYEGTYYYSDPSVANTQTNATSDIDVAKTNHQEVTFDPEDVGMDAVSTDYKEIPGGITVPDGGEVNVTIKFDLTQALGVFTVETEQGSVTALVPSGSDDDPVIEQI